MSPFSRFVRFLVALALVLPLGLAVPAFDAEAKKFRGFGGSKKWGSSKSKAKKADDDAETSNFPKVKWRGGRDDDASDDDNSGAAVPASSAAKKSRQDELPPAPEDYYAKRAKALLEADKAVYDSKPHPLAKGYPDKFVVICEGGCPNRKRAQIIDMQPRPAAKVESGMVPAVSSPDGARAAALQDGVVCMAGCYNGMQKTYTGRAAAEAGVGATYEDTWTTTVSDKAADTTSNSGSKPESGSWLSDIDRARESAADVGNKATTAFSADDSGSAAAAPKKIVAVTPSEGATRAETSAADDGAKTGTGTGDRIKTATKANRTVVAPASAETPPVIVEAKDVNPAPKSATTAPPITVVNAEAAKTSGSQDTAKPAKTSGAVDVAAVTSKPETKGAPEPAKKSGAEEEPIAVEMAGAKDTATTSSKESKGPAAAVATRSETPEPAKPVSVARQKDAPTKTQKIAAVSFEPDKSETIKTPKSVDQPAIVSSKDPEMNAAIKKARASLDSFWAKLANPAAGETDFSLKVAIKDGKKVEHFWVIGVKRDGDKISGTINNEPELVKSVTFGEHYEFTEEVISDWLYRRNGKMVGNETMRPLLKRMPEDAAAPYWAMYEKP